ncbi:MAG: 2Fe-2S iron-sulfur cluster-binding protein, partial [Thermodesulfovibrionales bacterium]
MEITIADGRTVTAEAGESIFAALKKNGIYLVAHCGGKGLCGKCHVKVIEGRSRVEAAAKIRKKDREENMVLACQAFPEEDILIEIPEDSKLVIGDKIAVSKSKGLLEFLHSVEQVFTPPVECTVLDLEPPTIHDNISDLERIKRSLEKKGIHGMRFSHDFVSSMSKALRDASWKVTLAYTDNLEAFALSPSECLNEYGIAIDIGTTTVVLYLVNCYDGSLI